MLSPRPEPATMHQRLSRSVARVQEHDRESRFFAESVARLETEKRKWKDEALAHRHRMRFGKPATPVRVGRRKVSKTPPALNRNIDRRPPDNKNINLLLGAAVVLLLYVALRAWQQPVIGHVHTNAASSF